MGLPKPYNKQWVSSLFFLYARIPINLHYPLVPPSNKFKKKEPWTQLKLQFLLNMVIIVYLVCSLLESIEHSYLGGGFKYFLIFTPIWGNDQI